MNHSQPGVPGQRYRPPPPNGPQTQPGLRPGPDMRNGNMPHGVGSPPGSAGNFQQSAQMSRAEKFEDEKKRIIESCFSRKTSDGSLNESYITHVRVVEDEDFPSHPPPPESAPQKKKPRVVMVAVRTSGRVKMYKGRENNPGGSFSIGKTWDLNDLRKIQSFTNLVPQTAEQQEWKQRAQETGFIVTMQKPYYWQCNTAKEKEFFIFSLIKIYRKYTSGKLPELEGFSAQEIDQLGGPATQSNATASQARPATNGVPPPPASRPVPSQEPPPRSRPPDIRPPDARQLEVRPTETPRQPPETPRGPPDTPRGMRRRPSQDSQTQGQERQLHSVQQQEHRPLHSAASRDRTLRQGPSNERMRLPGSFPSTESVPSQSSTQPLLPKRAESPGSQRTMATSATGNSRAPSENRYVPSHDHTQLGPQPTPSGRSSSEQARPNGVYPGQSRFRAPSAQSHRSETPDERPRTATKESDIPPALDIRSPKHRRPSTSGDQGSRSDHSTYTQKSSIFPSEPINGEARTESRQGRHSDRDYSSPSVNPFVTKPRSGSNARSMKPPSQDKIEHPAAPRAEEIPTPVTQTPPEPKPSETASPTPDPEPEPEAEAHRPGLGPMIKKKPNKEIASKFRKAATAYNAFKPRGGDFEKSPNEEKATGDGITGVFQAPSLLRKETDDSIRPKTPTIKFDSRPSTPEVKKDATAAPTSNQLASPPQDPSKLRDVSTPQVATQPQSKPPVPAQDERRKKRRSDHSAKYAKTLGIHPSLLEGRTYEIEAVLSDFGWMEDNQKATFEDLESGIRKEISRVEAGSWLGAVDNNDERTAVVGDMMDKVMAECEELDCLLTLYNVELGTLSEDVAYIEAQSQGLQVQTANQKLLYSELKGLLNTVSITDEQLKILDKASLNQPRAISEMEHTLSQVYSAMVTIDPKMRHGNGRPLSPDQTSLRRASHTGYGTSDLGSMQAVCEKKEIYQKKSEKFINNRFINHMQTAFAESALKTGDAFKEVMKSPGEHKLNDARLRELPKQGLWKYSPLMLFVRDMSHPNWDNLIKIYQGTAKEPYRTEFKEDVERLKRDTQKPNWDDAEVLFTAQEKENEGLVGRKLTVKRSKTVRNEGPSRYSNHERLDPGKKFAYEAFDDALQEQSQVIYIEQNFIVDFFHASSLANEDFNDLIASDPASRRGRDLRMPNPPAREYNSRIRIAIENIFDFWQAGMQSMADWSIKQNSFYTCGILQALETQLLQFEDTKQEFLIQVIDKLYEKLLGHFKSFIQEQIRAIEDTKVKIKKRKGLITFMKTFPNFSAVLEDMIQPPATGARSLEHRSIRTEVDKSYDKINEAMFNTLKLIAKESPTTSSLHAGPSVGIPDTEDKEALNHHILMIENMHHYLSGLSGRDSTKTNPTLSKWLRRAQDEYEQHLSLYFSFIIRRPLGKMLEFIEKVEEHEKSENVNDPPIAQRPSYGKGLARKSLGAYDAKEMRRGVETLRKRVEKHFADGEDKVTLVGLVWERAEEAFLGVLGRAERICGGVYGGEGDVGVGWGGGEVEAAFRAVAR